MCKCVPYLIIVCDMGVGVNARGSDGYYATVYCRCFIFYARQYVSYSILLCVWRVSFQNEIFVIEKFITRQTDHCEYDCNTHK